MTAPLKAVKCYFTDHECLWHKVHSLAHPTHKDFPVYLFQLLHLQAVHNNTDTPTLLCQRPRQLLVFAILELPAPTLEGAPLRRQHVSESPLPGPIQTGDWPVSSNAPITNCTRTPPNNAGETKLNLRENAMLSTSTAFSGLEAFACFVLKKIVASLTQASAVTI